MTERRQTQFTENIDNQKYVIYIGFGAASLCILYVYRFLCSRFHLATIVLSYGLGCLACYFGLKSSFLHTYLDKLKSSFVKKSLEADLDDVLSKGCLTCGSKDCLRHDGGAQAEPWVGLQVHKQLDQAIEEFYNTILEQFICTWYSKISPQPFFVDELRQQLRYASACLLRRAVKINYSQFITERLLPCALRHYTLCADLPEHASLLDGKLAIHPAAANRNAELKYLRCVTNGIMPYLLRSSEVQNPVVSVLIREIFAGWTLLLLTDVLADPYILNTLVILATGDETMAQLPTTPNYRVEFLETFVRQNDSVYTQRSKLLRMELDFVLNDQDYFYAFMQFMKTTSQIHLLQFYKDIKAFQIKLLNPEMKPNEEVALVNEAWDIYVTYFDPASPSHVRLPQDICQQTCLLLRSGASVRELRTSKALYEAARHTQAALEKIMLPRFLRTSEFYSIWMGSRIPTGYQKQATKKPQEKLMLQAIKLGNKLRGALRPQVLDGQVLDNELTDGDSMDNIDILKYLDTIASEESVCDTDLSTFKVVLTNVETRLQTPPRRGPIRLFTITVASTRGALWSVCRSELDFHLLRSKLREFHGASAAPQLPSPQSVLVYLWSSTERAPRRSCPARSLCLFTYSTLSLVYTERLSQLLTPVQHYLDTRSTLDHDGGSSGGGALWSVCRSELDFHLLRSKLREFHGASAAPQLPSPQDNSPLETLRYKYEDFLQRLLQESLLQTSELLHLFLTVEGDFSLAVQASSMAANNTDLTNIYQSVTHKLRKEKGQHLEGFLKSYLLSADMERFQTLKPGTTHIEEAIEVDEDPYICPAPTLAHPSRQSGTRDLHSGCFENNFGVEPVVCQTYGEKMIEGPTQCCLYLLLKIIKARTVITGLIGSILSLARGLTDAACTRALDAALRGLLGERTLAHLIRLGHGLIFGNKSSVPRLCPLEQRERARQQLMRSIPSSLTTVMGPGLPAAVHTAFEIIQRPQLNKQLVYNLLDLCLIELFPELNTSEKSPTQEPKS
ncbi:sorting nexin-14 [Plutella xylostella]|uniref:sorting nexin-14 n=1 Tax=Plutella xylostella TaxID=51655 RepID=UPI0020328571|nr:sorting nexin-14 [Plutella xylostella]